MTEDQRHNPKLLWAIAGGLIVVIIAVFIFQWMGESDNTAPIETAPTTAPATKFAPAEATPLQDDEAAPKQLVTEDLLKAPISENAALEAMRDFKGLPHRQQELGHKNGVLFVDDSIATTPQAAIAAMEVYKNAPVTLIAGGYDRGIDYQPLVEYVATRKINAVITLGPSGQRIIEGLAAQGYRAQGTETMESALKEAVGRTPQGGVILLSPAAPSFGLFRDYIERGQAFAKAAGF